MTDRRGAFFRSRANGDTSNDESFLDDSDKELNRVTRHPAAARYTGQMFEKAELRLENGERDIISHGSKRMMSGTEAHDYKLFENDDPLWQLLFPDNGELLATMFDEMLIQSGDDILLAYKVDVYGTAGYQDPHAQEEARPKGMHAFKVENVCHDQTRKVMVGAIKWCVLATLAVIVTDGTVVVGPDNKFFYPKATSRV
ncbi:hypothetical protein KI688_012735 [Linnemannia hyalina]|uniref:Uncharacterized protein n=1 Tax=Linnemannia hyalina TaxID=64524 RepID=A0A9P7XV88_9FUNG|nr:hypothetical protein KI688_012735 [Linnemannia hyalina]